MAADFLIPWSARVFVVCYYARICLDVTARKDAGTQRMGRYFWSAGCLIFLLHVALAFHYRHGWNHSLAYEHVLERTVAATGIPTGIGIYVNYCFGIIWLVDTFAWWRDLGWSQCRKAYWAVQALFGFLMLQSTAVFGPPFWIPVTVTAIVLLVALAVVQPWNRMPFPSTP